MSVEHLHPFAGEHAVQNAAIALEWQGELSDQTLLRIYKLAGKLNPSFDKVDLQKRVTIDLGNPNPSNQTDGLGGVVFQKITSLGTASKQLQVSRNNCIFVVHDYTRWAAMLADALQYFEIVLPVILEDKALSAVGLQYTDAFTWKEDPMSLSMASVFRQGTPWVPPNALTLKTLWHSHHGYMESSSEPVPNTLTNNVNINIQDVSGERLVQIVTSHRAALEKPVRLSTPSYMQVFSDIENHLHSLNKSLLARLLTDDAAGKIKLNAKG